MPKTNVKPRTKLDIKTRKLKLGADFLKSAISAKSDATDTCYIRFVFNEVICVISPQTDIDRLRVEFHRAKDNATIGPDFMKTKIITARGYQYEIADEISGMAKKGEYTLSATGVIFKYNSQHVLWLNGCPKIIASNDPELVGILPTLPYFEDVSKFEVVGADAALLKEKFQSKFKKEVMELNRISNQMLANIEVEDTAGKFNELNTATSNVYQIFNRLTSLLNSYKL